MTATVLLILVEGPKDSSPKNKTTYRGFEAYRYWRQFKRIATDTFLAQLRRLNREEKVDVRASVLTTGAILVSVINATKTRIKSGNGQHKHPRNSQRQNVRGHKSQARKSGS